MVPGASTLDQYYDPEKPGSQSPEKSTHRVDVGDKTLELDANEYKKDVFAGAR